MRRESIWLVNATEDFSALPVIREQGRRLGRSLHIVHRPRDRGKIAAAAPAGDELIRLIEAGDDALHLPDDSIDKEAEIVFLPCSERIDWAGLGQWAPLGQPDCMQPLVGTPPRISSRRYITGPVGWFGWRAGGELASRILREPSAWQANGIDVVEAIQHWPDPPRWQSIPLRVAGAEDYPVSSPPVLTMASRVLVIIPFYRCEEWLHACLASMTRQTLPAENIVVVDDCSPALPAGIVEAFPEVTLLSTARNVGPERIHNNVMHSTDYDAYMVQDPDDWSSHDRIEVSLRGAEQTGAGVVGTHEFCVDHAKGALELSVYPPDVNHAMSQGMGHHLLQTGGLFSRSLAMKIGGFDGHLKLGADTDFIARAWHAGQLVNLPAFCIFRRVRAGSLTTDATTGYQSAARRIEQRYISLRARRHLESARAGREPDVFVKHTDPVGFVHHRGPKLRPARGAAAV